MNNNLISIMFLRIFCTICTNVSYQKKTCVAMMPCYVLCVWLYVCLCVHVCVCVTLCHMKNVCECGGMCHAKGKLNFQHSDEYRRQGLDRNEHSCVCVVGMRAGRIQYICVQVKVNVVLLRRLQIIYYLNYSSLLIVSMMSVFN